MHTKEDSNATATQASLSDTTDASAEDRSAFFADARERLTDAVTTAVDAVRKNPKTAAAIAAGATAAVAGAAYGATKRTASSKDGGKSSAGSAGKRSTAKK